MKMRTVPLVVWFAQLLVACAFHDKSLTTPGLEEVTTKPQLTTRTPATKKLRITISTTQTMTPQATEETTASPPTEELLTQWTQPLTSTVQRSVTKLLLEKKLEGTRSSPNSEGTENASNTISTSHYKVMNLGQTGSSKPASETEGNNENPETGTRSGALATGIKTEYLTSQDRVHTRHAKDEHHWESGTSFQTDHTIQTTSWKVWMNSLTVSPVKLGNKAEVTQSDKGSYNFTITQQGPAHDQATYTTTQTEQETEQQTSNGNSTVRQINVASAEHHSEVTTGYFITTPKAVTVTQVTSSNGKNIPIHNTEGPLVSNTKSPDSDSNQERGERIENATTTTYDVQNTETLPQSSEGSYDFITGQQGQTTANDNTTQIELDMHTGNQMTSGNSTVGHINAVHSSELDQDSQVTTGHYFTTSMTQVTSSDGKNITMQNVEGSSAIANTVSTASSENVTTTQRTVRYTTRTYGRIRTEATGRHTDSVWSTSSVITLTSNGTEAVTTWNQSSNAGGTVWLDCFNKASSSQRLSKRVCFIAMWCLGMAASIFLGLTIFLWVRLSVVKKRAKLKGRKRSAGKATRKEKQSLWATDGASTEERVEFWYANGSTLEADKKGKVREREEKAKRRSGKQKEGKEEDMWIQPRVTVQDITEFWYANGRRTNEDRMERQRELSGQ